MARILALTEGNVGLAILGCEDILVFKHFYINLR